MDDITRQSRKQYGPYQCIERIGSGAQGAVFKALHEDSGHMVALRVMTVTVKDVEGAIAQCKEQLAEFSRFYVPNSVEIEDFGSDNGTLYIATNIMRGGSLRDRMKIRHISGDESEQTVLPSPADVLLLTERLAAALDSLHLEGMVHGQLEPRSIMFDEAGNAYLADIGFTRLIKIIYRLDSTNSFNMSKYSPPELWNGERPGPATDQYALACIVYELLTGKAPFNAPSIFGLMQAHANDVAAPPHYVRKELPNDLAMVFWQALAKPAKRRFDTVDAFHDALYRALSTYESERTDFLTFDIHAE